jgi:hypothetical protein
MERRIMRRRRRRVNAFRFILALVIIAGLIAGGFFLFNKLGVNITPTQQPPGATPTPTSVLAPTLSPSPGEGADPSDYGFQTDIQANGKNVSSYTRNEKISFPVASAYTALQGVTTFRGNNYRTTASYGTADVQQGKLAVEWEKNISAIRGDEIMGTGVGWTGQPLLVRWSEKMRSIMNMYPEKKRKEGLIEVIYPTLDGHIYFYDLDDGSYTRDPINLGVVIKGTASIDPRGYPLLYVGQGDTVNHGAMKYRIISLIDQEVLYELNGKDPFSHRKWTAFDSSALVDAGSDTLIEPGENGILYTIKLNTAYDPDTGTLSIDPDPPVKYRYTADGMGEGSGKRWWGTENSMIGWRGYAFYTDNGGYLQCVDLNTMSPVWVQDVTDDSDSTMVLEEDADNQTAYLYTACQVDKQPNAKTAGRAYIRKVDALTGKVLWTRSYACSYDSHVAGGVLASPILGKEGSDIEDVVIYNIAKEKEGGSLLVALDRKTGDEVWTLRIRNYCWSSPVAVYDDAGKSYIVQADSAGRMLLIEGATSEVLDTIQIQQATIEASPAVFGDRIVIGTRGQKVVCVRIK